MFCLFLYRNFRIEDSCFKYLNLGWIITDNESIFKK